MVRRTRLWIAGGILALLGVVAVAAVVLWNTVLTDDAPSQANLADAVASVNDGQRTTPAAATTPAGSADIERLTGTWTLAPAGDSFVGYRVKEELATIGAFTAVGRTENLTATMTFDGRAITAVTVEADLTSLRSDDARRDNALRQQALETERYPTATFNLTEPIVLDAVPEEGVPVTATARGDLTLRDVTRPASINLEGLRAGDLVVVVGSLDVQFADFSIAQPRSFVVLSVEDRGVLELQLVFERSSAQG
jgi:polyisoprenoid-binding protein YceI